MDKSSVISSILVFLVLPAVMAGEPEMKKHYIYNGGYSAGVTVEMLADNSRVETSEGYADGEALRLVFEADNWAVARISLPRRDLRAWRKAGGCLSLRLKGGTGGEQIYIGFINRKGGRVYANYIPLWQRGKLTTDWQRLIIPLKDYAEHGSFWQDGKKRQKKFDWKKIESIQVSVKPVRPDQSGKTEVIIELDDLCFSSLPLYENNELARLLLREEQRLHDMRDYFRESFTLPEKNRVKALAYLAAAARDLEMAGSLLADEAGQVRADALLRSCRERREQCLPLAFEPLPVEERGAWFTAFRPGQLGERNGKQIKKMIKKAKRAGLNTIYLQMARNYPSSLNNQFLEYRGWDPVRTVVEQCRKSGLEVHAWYVTFRIHRRDQDDPNVLELDHPDWFANSLPVVAGEAPLSSWLCPARQEYRRYVAERAEELVANYGFDGFHFDYIRYPETEKRSCHYCREKFAAVHGFDPGREDEELSVEERLVWNDWRERQVRQMVVYVAGRLKGLYPELKVSAAVFPDPMYRHVSTWPLQNWWDWLDAPDLDYLVPMEYSQHAYTFRRYVKANEEISGLRLPLYHGLGNYRYKRPADMLDQLLILRQSGAAGMVFFDLDTLKKDQVEALRRGPFRQQAVTPHSDYGRAVRLYLGHLGELCYRVTKEGKVRPVVGELLKSEFEILSELAGAGKLSDRQVTDNLLAGMERTRSQLAYLAKLDFLDQRLANEFAGKLSSVNRMVHAACREKVDYQQTVPKLLDVPRISVPVLKTPPEIDGVIADDWGNIAPLGPLKLNNGEGTEREISELYLGATQHKLYIAFRCRQAEQGWVPTPALEDGDRVWRDNCVRIFLMPEWKAYEKMQEKMQKEKLKIKKDGARKTVEPGDVLEQEKTPQGLDFWLWQLAVAKNGVSWLENKEHYDQVERAVTERGGYWCVEIGVPFELFGGTPKRGAVWKANFARMNYSQWVMPRSAWSVTYGPFSLPERLGYIEFK